MRAYIVVSACLQTKTTYALWDASSIYGCACDEGFTGYDCSERSCISGYDALADVSVFLRILSILWLFQSSMYMLQNCLPLKVPKTKKVVIQFVPHSQKNKANEEQIIKCNCKNIASCTGSLTLSWRGHYTTALKFDATKEVVKAALTVIGFTFIFF